MKRSQCSMCYGDPNYRTGYGCKCTDCAGLGSFEHWSNRPVAAIQAEMAATRQCLEEAERESSDVSNSQNRDIWLERVAYWKYRIQTLSLELFEAEP